jgi:hypothetical protein
LAPLVLRYDQGQWRQHPITLRKIGSITISLYISLYETKTCSYAAPKEVSHKDAVFLKKTVVMLCTDRTYSFSFPPLFSSALHIRGTKVLNHLLKESLVLVIWMPRSLFVLWVMLAL